MDAADNMNVEKIWGDVDREKNGDARDGFVPGVRVAGDAVDVEIKWGGCGEGVAGTLEVLWKLGSLGTLWM
jgi:hypothetical protein